jgi:peptide/nickel transport system permease protein
MTMATATTATELHAVRALTPRTPLRVALTFARRKPLGAVGALLVLVLVAVALVGPVLSPYDPRRIDSAVLFQGPNKAHPFGTDDKGRDVLSRVLTGAGVSLRVGAIAAGVGVTVGLLVGLVSGYVGGKLDFFAQRVVDSFQAFPALFLALALTSALGQTIGNVGIALAIVAWPTSCRVVRSAVLAQKTATYVDAARAIGARTPRILFRHILPNVASIYIILVTAGLAQAILVESSLSFLGAGVDPDKLSWGFLLESAKRFAVTAPWTAIFPGLAITLAVFGFNLFGDALRDQLDPRLRGR